MIKRYEGLVVRVQREKKWDLSVVSGHSATHAHKQPNHLLSAPPIFLKIFFRNTADFQAVRREILPLAESNSAKFTAVDAYADVVGADSAMNGHRDDDGAEKAWGEDEETQKKNKDREPADCIIDIREHDIAYYLRVAIDLSELY